MKNLTKLLACILLFAYSCEQVNNIDVEGADIINELDFSPSSFSNTITYTLYADHITNQKGYWQGGPIEELNTKDQSGQDDDWGTYVDFQPNNLRYQGNVYFYLPQGVDKSDVLEIKVRTNFKGWHSSTQKWTWKLKNFTTNKWNYLGNNSFADDWVWSEKTWTKTSNQYIKSDGEIRLQYRSNNDYENSYLDYLVVEITVNNNASNGAKKLLEPAGTSIYHAAFPDFGGFEDQVSNTAISSFETLAGKDITWAYFSDNWFDGIHFPAAEVSTIHNAGKVPFIRIMPRNQNEDTPDPVYTMQAFLDGDFDAELTQWAIDAKNTGIPLLVEFGTEVNGYWFPWNAKWNGKNNKTGYGDPNVFDGTERFRDTYRHIIDIFNAQNVDNITWFFHVDAYNDPNTNWNKMKDYYPGDNYIDWIGISVYGPQDSNNGWWSFEDVLNDSWAEISSISATGKPIAILEWGVIDNPALGSKAQWISDAFYSIGPNGTYAEDIDAISYWHENFGNTNLRIDTSPGAKQAYQNGVSNAMYISTPTFSQ